MGRKPKVDSHMDAIHFIFFFKDEIKTEKKMSSCKKQKLNVVKCFSTQGMVNATTSTSTVTIDIPLRPRVVRYASMTITAVPINGFATDPITGCTYEAIGTISGTVGFPHTCSAISILPFAGTFSGTVTITCSGMAPVVVNVTSLPVESGTLEVIVTTCPIIPDSGEGIFNGTIVFTATTPGNISINNITPLANFCPGAEPTLSIIQITNTGGALEYLYGVTGNTPFTFPSTFPSPAIPGVGGLLTVLPPGASITLTLQNLSLLFSIPGETTTGTASPSSLQVKFNLKFCINSCDSCDSGCKKEPTVVEVCATAKGNCATMGTQVLYGGSALAADFLLAEVCNTESCSGLIQLLSSNDNTLTPLFPFGFGMATASGATSTIQSGQCFLLACTNVLMLTSTCVAPIPPSVTLVTLNPDGLTFVLASCPTNIASFVGCSLVASFIPGGSSIITATSSVGGVCTITISAMTTPTLPTTATISCSSIIPFTCNITATIKALYCSPSCESNTSSPMIMTNRGASGGGCRLISF